MSLTTFFNRRQIAKFKVISLPESKYLVSLRMWACCADDLFGTTWNLMKMSILGKGSTEFCKESSIISVFENFLIN